jgi:hypothetical protein
VGRVGVLEGGLDDEALHAIQPGIVIQLRAAVELHPVFQIDALMTNFVANAPAQFFCLLCLSERSSDLLELLDSVVLTF